MGKGANLTIKNLTDVQLKFGTSDMSSCWQEETIERVSGIIPPHGQSEQFYIEADGGITCALTTSEVKFWVKESANPSSRFANVHIGESNSEYRQLDHYTNNLVATAFIEHGGQDTIRVEVSPNSNWMTALDDKLPLTELSIPGTHDSGTYKLGSGPAKCQSLSITEQLEAGIRFLDIRCCYLEKEKVLTIHHGSIYCDLNFNDVLGQVTGFLAAHPHETVLLMVKQENSKADGQVFANKVEEYLNSYSQWVYQKTTKSSEPLGLRLSDVRGKIVLLRRYTEGSIGYDVRIGGGTACGDTVAYQDIYEDTNYVSVKKPPLKLLLEVAHQHPQDGLLYLNYISMSGIATWPETLAKELNQYAEERVQACRQESDHGTTQQRFGILPMDFPTSSLIQQLINSNF